MPLPPRLSLSPRDLYPFPFLNRTVFICLISPQPFPYINSIYMLYHFHCIGDIALSKGAQESFAFGCPSWVIRKVQRAVAEWDSHCWGIWMGRGLTARARASIELGPEGQTRKAQSGDAKNINQMCWKLVVCQPPWGQLWILNLNPNLSSR